MYKITLRPIFKSLEGTTGAGFLLLVIEFRRFLIWDRGPQMFKTFWRLKATTQGQTSTCWRRVEEGERERGWARCFRSNGWKRSTQACQEDALG